MPLAIKVFKDHICHMRRVREADYAKRNRHITHENIVRFYDVVYDQTGQPWQVLLERVFGGSLSDMLIKFGGLSRLDLDQQACPKLEAYAKIYTKQLVDAVHFLHHTHNIIHRDIKADNILVDSYNGVLKLADFNTFKEYGHVNYAPYTVVGTANYWGPDSFNEFPKRQDIWALGLTVWQMLTASVPPADCVPNYQDSWSREVRDFLQLCFDRSNTEISSHDLFRHDFLKDVHDHLTQLVDQNDDASLPTEDVCMTAVVDAGLRPDSGDRGVQVLRPTRRSPMPQPLGQIQPTSPLPARTNSTSPLPGQTPSLRRYSSSIAFPRLATSRDSAGEQSVWDKQDIIRNIEEKLVEVLQNHRQHLWDSVIWTANKDIHWPVNEETGWQQVAFCLIELLAATLKPVQSSVFDDLMQELLDAMEELCAAEIKNEKRQEWRVNHVTRTLECIIASQMPALGNGAKRHPLASVLRRASLPPHWIFDIDDRLRSAGKKITALLGRSPPMSSPPATNVARYLTGILGAEKFFRSMSQHSFVGNLIFLCFPLLKHHSMMVSLAVVGLRLLSSVLAVRLSKEINGVVREFALGNVCVLHLFSSTLFSSKPGRASTPTSLCELHLASAIRFLLWRPAI